ncbi:MAG: glutaredoxin family protein [Dehalococcoidia bacterium]|nr:glutaredoxin family protein [Dehalococcoidia bacterium]
MAIHVQGKKGPHIMLYTLSTCPKCQKVKNLMAELEMEYFYEDADLLADDARRDIIADMERWNPKRSFPTTVIDNNHCVIGYQENDLRILLRT